MNKYVVVSFNSQRGSMEIESELLSTADEALEAMKPIMAEYIQAWRNFTKQGAESEVKSAFHHDLYDGICNFDPVTGIAHVYTEDGRYFATFQVMTIEVPEASDFASQLAFTIPHLQHTFYDVAMMLLDNLPDYDGGDEELRSDIDEAQRRADDDTAEFEKGIREIKQVLGL